MVRYVRTPEMEKVVRKIIEDLSLHYIDSSRIRCVKSYQSKSLKTHARIHTASRAFFVGVGMPPIYVIEFISDNFDKLSEEEKIKVIIHELLHIPRSFSGGLVTHGRLDFEEECERLYKFLLGKNCGSIIPRSR